MKPIKSLTSIVFRRVFTRLDLLWSVVLLFQCACHGQEFSRGKQTPWNCWQATEEMIENVPVRGSKDIGFFRSNRPSGETETTGGFPSSWRAIEKDITVTVSEIATVNGRALLAVTYRSAGDPTELTGSTEQVFLYETTKDQFRPFYITNITADLGKISYRVASGRADPFVLIASCYLSGTGAISIHRVFSFKETAPKLVDTIQGGRGVPVTKKLAKWLE
jgi:hypothetical protein